MSYPAYVPKCNLSAYRLKSDAELLYIIKDASEAAAIAKTIPWAADSEAKYLDQVNDAITVMAERRRASAQRAR